MSQQTGFTEEKARSYDERVRRHIPGYEILHALSETILAAELPENASVLVAGVGTGTEILELAPKHPGWRFVGVDPSAGMIAMARQKVAEASLADRVELRVGTVETLPEDAYDAATLLLVLHFLADKGEKEALLSAIADRLKPGAPFFVASLFGDPESTRYQKLNSFRKSWAIARGMSADEAQELFDLARKDLHVVPEERIKTLLRNAGYIDVQRVYQMLAVGMWFARAAR